MATTSPAPIFPEFLDPRILPGDRIDRPVSWGRPQNIKWAALVVSMAWHHIIPYELLCNVWNHLVHLYINTNDAVAPKAMEAYILLLKPELKAYVDLLLTQMRAERYRKRIVAGVKTRAKRQSTTTTRLDLLPLSNWDRSELREAAVWPVWNMVEGPEPNSRSDDPGNGFDIFRGGLASDEVKRMEAIENLYDKWLRNFATIPLRTLTDAIQYAGPSIKWCKRPIHFRSAMWTYNNQSANSQVWSKS